MSIKRDETWKLIDKWIASVNHASPINIAFLTEPVSEAITRRIRSLESAYQRYSVYRFLIDKGVYPVIMFSSVSGALAFAGRRSYQKWTPLVLHLVGVVYPTYCCWQLVKAKQLENQEEQLKSWLTYWMMFGSFQVLDHWVKSDLFMYSRKKYDLYKLLILYWAQSPHSKGSRLLFRHVIQKPESNTREDTPAKDPADPHTIVAIQPKEAFKYIDGFQSPHLMSTHQSSSSSGSSSEEDDHQNQPVTDTTASEKEIFPLLMNSSEAAW